MCFFFFFFFRNLFVFQTQNYVIKDDGLRANKIKYNEVFTVVRKKKNTLLAQNYRDPEVLAIL